MKNDFKQPLFSVVIPAYNRAKVITRAIDSVIAQKFTDYEIVVIDDGSSDDLKSVCDKYNNEKIHYFYQENAGACAARNAGIKKSQGIYISFLDSDDTWEPEYLNEVAGKFSSDDDFGCVWVRSVQKHLPDEKITFMDGIAFEGNVYAKILRQGYLTSTSFITVKRSLLESLEGFDINLPASQDDDISFRIAKSAKIGCINKTLGTLYIDSSINRISSSASRRAHGWFLLWRKFADDLLTFCGKKEFEKKFFNVYSMFYEIDDKEGLKTVEDFLIEKIGASDYHYKFINFNNNKIIRFAKKIKKKAFLAFYD